MTKGGDFWTRRRAAVEAQAQEEKRLEEAVAAEAREAEMAERPDAEILADLGLPDPDTLHAGDDFKVFLTETVPARIRSRALRRLWSSNPILANVDGLVDYGEDFTDASCVIENLQTAYQVGKGMTAHVEELARQAEAAEMPPEDEAGEAELLTEADDGTTIPEPESDDMAQEQETVVSAKATLQDDALTEAPQPTRRMRFRCASEGAQA